MELFCVPADLAEITGQASEVESYIQGDSGEAGPHSDEAGPHSDEASPHSDEAGPHSPKD